MVVCALIIVHYRVSEFHDCFFLFAREKGVASTEELTIIMRSLGFSPTSTEIESYLHEFKKGMCTNLNYLTAFFTIIFCFITKCYHVIVVSDF